MSEKKEPQQLCKIEKGWRSIKPAGITEPGSAKELRTGDWRSKRPVHDMEKCIHCLQCFIYCPDCSIITEEGKFKEFDYYHCKGCGICAKVCPVKCIEMVDEYEAKEKEKNDKGKA